MKEIKTYGDLAETIEWHTNCIVSDIKYDGNINDTFNMSQLKELNLIYKREDIVKSLDLLRELSTCGKKLYEYCNKYSGIYGKYGQAVDIIERINEIKAELNKEIE